MSRSTHRTDAEPSPPDRPGEPDATATAPDGRPAEARVRPAPVEWLWLVIGSFLVWRYFFFYDDAFVYFRYVDNLLFLKIGLVYNEGEFVEGFSSPLWALMLIGLRSTGLTWSLLLQVVAVLCYVLFWWMLVVVNRRLAPAPEGGAPIVNLPLAYLCACYGFLCYFSGGLETVLLHLAAGVTALEATGRRSRAVDAGLALMPLARHELILPWAVLLTARALRERRLPVRLLLWTALPLGAYGLFRIVYYADLFPVTFYLKDTSNWGQGFVYLQDTFATYGLWVLLAAGALLGIAAGRARARWGARALMVAAALPVLLYVTRIGGAPIHYRYLAYPFALLALSTAGLLEAALTRRAPARLLRLSPALGVPVALLVSWRVPPQLDVHPLTIARKPQRDEPVVTVVDKINEATYHRQRIHAVDGATWRPTANEELMRAYERENRPFRYRGLIGTGWCQHAYKNFDKRVVHSFGLTEGVLARCSVPSRRPGHKPGLKPLAEDLIEIGIAVRPAAPGRFRRAVEQFPGRYPWIARNLDSIEVVERKVYNRHAFLENLGLAFTFPAPIVP